MLVELECGTPSAKANAGVVFEWGSKRRIELEPRPTGDLVHSGKGGKAAR